jgi:predicted DNA-binding transcriptional regulator AlpA
MITESLKPKVAKPMIGGTLDPDTLLTTAEVARRLNLSASFFAKARLRGDGPRYSKFNRAVRYRWADVQEWIKARGRYSTSGE